MLIIDKRIIQIIIFIVKFDNWILQCNTLFHPKAFWKWACRIITKNNFQRNNLHFFIELLCIWKFFDKVSCHTSSIQLLKNKRWNLIIQDSLTCNLLFLHSIESSCLILITWNNKIFILSCIDIFSFSRIYKLFWHFKVRLSYYLSTFYHKNEKNTRILANK